MSLAAAAAAAAALFVDQIDFFLLTEPHAFFTTNATEWRAVGSIATSTGTTANTAGMYSCNTRRSVALALALATTGGAATAGGTAATATGSGSGVEEG